jgi:hypothetical protein
MPQATHTPGPWSFHCEDGDVGVYAAGSHTWVADIWGKNVANARLIAASPELLEALIELKQAIEFTPLGIRQIAALEQAKVAIAKAEGTNGR